MSADVALGLPYNVLQYHALHCLMAEETGYELGTMYWNIDNAHIYLRHEADLLVQVGIKQVNGDYVDTNVLSQEVVESVPKLILPEGTGFFNRRLSNAKIVGYKHMGKHSYEVAI